MYLWLLIMLGVFIAAAPFGIWKVKRAIREQVLEETLKKQGSEATNALDSHMRGEW